MSIARTGHTPFQPPAITVESIGKESSAFPSGRIQRIALRALEELTLALALTAICIPFVATWAIVLEMFVICLAGTVTNTIIYIITKNHEKKHNFISKVIHRGVFSCYGSMNATTLVHEIGHFITAKLLFKGTPKIRIIPFDGGWTNWSTRYLTSFGCKLGFRCSIFLTTLAGPGLVIIVASIVLIAGLVLRYSHHRASSYLMSISGFSFASHAEYALSTLWTPSTMLEHDFVRLQTFGVHPIVAAIVIISIPIIISLGAKIYRSLQLQHAPELLFG